MLPTAETEAPTVCAADASVFEEDGEAEGGRIQKEPDKVYPVEQAWHVTLEVHFEQGVGHSNRKFY